MYERDPYAEAHRKGVGFGLFVAWVITCVLAAAAGETISKFIQGYVPREGAQAWLNYLLTGTAIGATIGVGQGLVLSSYLGLRGMVEWVTATVVGRVARIFVLVALLEVTAGITLEGHFLFVVLGRTLLYASMGAIAGVVLGTAQSFVLQRHVIRPRWWVWVNVAASSVVLAVVGWLPDYIPENTLTGALNGLITGIITGIALNDLLREPLSGQGWWLTWKRERPVKPSLDPGTQRSPEVLLEELRAGRRP